MNAIHEVAAITAKGQITLPKAIRQALGVDVGGKVAFDFLGDKVVVSRAPTAHEDPAIAGFCRCWNKTFNRASTSAACPMIWPGRW